MGFLKFLLTIPFYIIQYLLFIVYSLFWLIKKILSPFIGQLEWKAPFWTKWIKKEYFKKNSLLIGSLIYFIAASSIGGFYGYNWYQSWLKNRPGPIIIAPTVYIDANPYISKTPQPTNYRLQNPVFDTFSLYFEKQVAPLESFSKDITEGISISPKIDGKWKWNSYGDMIVFYPAQDWEIDQKYIIKIEPEKLLAENIRVKNNQFDFITEQMNLNIYDTEFYQNPENPTEKKSIFHVRFSHPVDVASFEKSISLTMVNQKQDTTLSNLKFSVIYNDSKMDAWIHSEPIPLQENERKIKLLISKGVMSSKSTKSKAEAAQSYVSVPSYYSLTIGGLYTLVTKNEKSGKYDQILTLNASDAIKNTDLKRATQIWMLPKKNPKYPNIQSYNWHNSEVTNEILSKSQKLDIKVLDTENEYEKNQNIIFKGEPNRYIFVKFQKDITSIGGYKNADNLIITLKINDYPNMLQFMSQGSILPLNGDQKVSIVTQNVIGMKIEVGHLRPSQLQHLVTFSSYNDFAHSRFNDVNEDHFVEKFELVEKIPVTSPESTSYLGIDLAKFFKKNSTQQKGVFLLKLRPWDVNNNRSIYYSNGKTNDYRLIVITDLGILVKKSQNGSHDVFVQSVSTGKPVENAKVSVVGKNGISLLTKTSDSEGHVVFKNLDSYYNEKEPVMYLVEKGDDISFLPTKNYTLYGYERSLDFSRFDVGGISEDQNDKGSLQAYLFSDRGLYRPGDKFNIGTIVRSKQWNTSLKGIPLLAEIYDSRYTLVSKQKITLDETGFNELSYKTQEDSPTGEWFIYLYMTNQQKTMLGYTSVNIKEFEPDRLKVDILFEPKTDKQWISPEELVAKVKVENLFGTSAQNLRVSTSMTLKPASLMFSTFKDYYFFENQSNSQTFKTQLEDALTDENGIATLKLGLQSFEPASYYVQLLTEAFEAGSGRSVMATKQILVSPYKYFIGSKSDGDTSYIKKDSQRNLHFIAINPLLETIEVNNLKLRLLERVYISVLTKQDSGVYKYESKLKEKLVKEELVNISSNGLNYLLPTNNPGDYVIQLVNEDDFVLYKSTFSVAGNANLTRSLERDAELKLKLSKSEYKTGEDIEISIQAPYVGSGIITIERDKVYAWKWFSTKTTNSVQTINLPEGIEGNAYINVQFLRDINSNEIFMSPLSYAVASFNINRSGFSADLSISSPSIAKPSTKLPIEISTTSKQKVVVFGVDEGILQVARYQFKDPLDFFFRKKELSVESMQILDLILPEFSKIIRSLAPGGDVLKDSSAASRHLNPFKRKTEKAVAFWSGIMDVDGNKTISFDLPEYFNGKLRIMAISVSPLKIGATQTSTFVRNDFILSPNAPYVVAPDDEFEISLSIANNLETDGKKIPITISATTSNHLSIIGESEKKIELAKGNEGVLRFKIKATKHLGSADIVFIASYDNKSVTRKATTSVRPLVPFRTDIKLGQMRDKKETLSGFRDMFSEYSEREASLSHSPFVLAGGLNTFLENYSYSCSEQIVSRAIPALFVNTHPEFKSSDSDISYRIYNVIDTLRIRQNNRGGIGLWESSVQTDPFVTSYVVQFLLEAKEKGNMIPEDMLQKANMYLTSVISNENLNDEFGLRVRAFSVYLLTRQNQVTTNHLSTIQSRLQNYHGKDWDSTLSAFYIAASYKMLKMDKEAELLLEKIWKKLDKAYSEAWWTQNFNDPLIQNATMLYVTLKHFPEKVDKIPTRALENMVLMLREQRYTSISAAMSILALESYSQALEKNKKGESLTIHAVDQNNISRIISQAKGYIISGNFENNDTSVIFENNSSNTPAWYVLTQTGFDKKPSKEAIKNGLEIIREYTDQNGTIVNKVKLGEKINVRISVRSISKEALDDIAIVDLIPGGFEIVQQLAPELNDNENTGWISPIQSKGSTWNPVFTDVREDRVVIFGRATSEAQDFIYQIKATNVGTFSIPATFAEAMYDRAINALSPNQGQIEILNIE